jgi:PAS domain-containing protein
VEQHRVAQQPIEMILLHHWASYMAIPIGVFDAEGNLVYYNEPAEAVVGTRFDEAGEINASEFASLGVPTDLEGRAIPNDELPTPIALTEGRLAHRRLRIRGLDGSWRQIESTAFPIVGQGGRLLGAITIWEPQA